MRNKTGTLLLASVLSLAMAPAFAQDGDEDTAVLTYSGEVMVSSGGEYVTAANGQVVQEGQSFMVHSGSAATITYDNNCQINYVEPGTYVVPDDCDPAVAYASTGGTGTAGAAASSAALTAGIVAGVVGLTAAAIESNVDDGDTGPAVSP